MPPSATSLRAALVALLQERSLRLGEYTLSSGRKSHYYVDARLTTMSAQGLEVIGLLGVSMIAEANWNARLVGGLTLGADPLAYSISVASCRIPPILDAFVVRKESKGHGTGRRIEGCFTEGSRVVVVEDVITTGGSALTAINAVEDARGVVVGVLGVVDRMESGRAAIEKAGYPVLTMVTIRDLGVEPDMSVS
jgi:orotate phosphoribosyltransferase